MSLIVLDASALIALLLDEAGGAKVAERIAGARMSAVNLAEVIGHFGKNGMPADAAQAMLQPLPIDIIAADRELAYLAGNLRAATSEAGLSLGDRFCLALAQREKLPAWTADREWKRVADQIGVEVVLIR